MIQPSRREPWKGSPLDARHWALGLSGSIAIGIGLINDGTGFVGVVLGIIVAFVGAFLIGLIAMPPWRDPKYRPWAGALVILLAGVVAAVVIVLIPESVWPS